MILAFTSNHSTRVRLKEIITEDFPLVCGLPQGSPLSPIIFLLYIVEILEDNPRLRFGYTDNIALLATGPSLEESITAIGREISWILDWGT